MMGFVGAAGRSCTGDSTKISDNVIEEDVVSFETPLPNLNGGRRLSAEGFCGILPVERPLARPSPGRRRVGFLLLLSG